MFINTLFTQFEKDHVVCVYNQVYSKPVTRKQDGCSCGLRPIGSLKNRIIFFVTACTQINSNTIFIIKYTKGFILQAKYTHDKKLYSIWFHENASVHNVWFSTDGCL